MAEVEAVENGLKTAFGQEREPVVEKRRFSTSIFQATWTGRTSLSVVDRNLSPSPSLLLLFKKSTKFDSEFFSHNGARISPLSRSSPPSMKISLPPFHLSLSSSRLQNSPSFCPFTRGPFMPIALDKVFKAR